METATYATLSRQTGLLRELQVVANNIANSATTGFRQEGLIFAEYVSAGARGANSLSMGHANARNTSFEQGALVETGGRFDLAIEGEGFFMVETPSGQRLTRAGSFAPNAQGDLVSPEGYAVLDAGGAPIFVPPLAQDLRIAPDGTISADGQPLGQVGLYLPADPTQLLREDGVRFRADGGVEPALQARVLQGFLEGSNVNAISEITRLIEVQRAYEMGQSFLETEDQRIRSAVETLMK